MPGQVVTSVRVEYPAAPNMQQERRVVMPARGLATRVLEDSHARKRSRGAQSIVMVDRTPVCDHFACAVTMIRPRSW
jgi:hypothetical protein